MNYSDALSLMKDGESLQLPTWSESEYIYIHFGKIWRYPQMTSYTPTQKEILATDWQVA